MILVIPSWRYFQLFVLLAVSRTNSRKGGTTHVLSISSLTGCAGIPDNAAGAIVLTAEMNSVEGILCKDFGPGKVLDGERRADNLSGMAIWRWADDVRHDNWEEGGATSVFADAAIQLYR